MIRPIIAAVLFAVAVMTVAPVVVPGSDPAAAQSAGDRKVQPGNSQCRDSVGRKC
jgi:hypothetical protein